ncbi:AAA family ATPase [Corallococcus sp. Z5C101001]|uniref:AAA family ATPase n=1 Tax=Corallococcus sp. Z5C101001 TaxID=2596829 RepID=UPI00117E572C|nr:AAA family ATPase [Corallococcus sp. Z5C101001]TSC32947.1 AAA family ATPase [Corallococcus sp. Z5C101001]
MTASNLKALLTEDLAALTSAIREANRRASQAGQSVFGPQALDQQRQSQYAAFRELAGDPFSVRIDAICNGNETRRLYLTKARQGLAIQGGAHIVSWTSPLARLRLFDLGEEEEIVVPRGEQTYRVELRGRFQALEGDLRNGRYEALSGAFDFASARQTIDAAAHDVQPESPVTAAAFGLREIIFETDRTQDKYLRMPLQGHLVVEGAPGSGKTTLALQRVAYALEAQHDELDVPREAPHFTEESTLVVTYSDILVRYLRRLLLDLRIPQVPVISLETWTRNLLDGAHALDNVKADRLKDSKSLAAIKTHVAVLEPLKKWTLQSLRTRWPSALTALESHLSQCLGPKDPRKTEYLREIGEAEKGLRSGSLRLGKLVSAFRIANEHFSRERDSAQAIAVREGLNAFVAQVVNHGEVYLGFLKSEEFARHATTLIEAKVLKRTAAEKAIREARAHAAEGLIRKNDHPLLAWMVRWMSDGVPSAPTVRFVKPWERVSHLVLDEAQDFSPVESRLLLELADTRYRCVTAVGDLMQRLKFPGGLPSWPTGGFSLDGGNGQVGLFRKNYRQTRELGELAASYYQAHFGAPAPFESRSDLSGMKPELIQGGNVDARLKELASRVIKLRREHPEWSIVLICDDDDLRERISSVVRPLLREHHISCRRSKAVDLHNRDTVHITPTLHTKGLEFDCVGLIEPGRAKRNMTDDQLLRSTYVALTRAARHLLVTAPRKLTSPIAELQSHFALTPVQQDATGENRSQD